MSCPSIMTELFASQSSGWMVHSMGVPVRNVIGNVIRPENFNEEYLIFYDAIPMEWLLSLFFSYTHVHILSGAQVL